jgi:hypothetical protein
MALMTEQLMIQYVKDELTAGVVNLELSDDTIKRNLDRALMLSSDYFNYSDYKTITIQKTSGDSGWCSLADIDESGTPTVLNVYPVANVMNIDAALLGLGSVFISTTAALNPQLNAYSNMLHKLTQLESILGRNARVIGEKLFVSHYFGGTVTVEYIPEKVEIGKIHEGDWVRFLIEYTTALCKRQMAQSRGKYVIGSNPSESNAAELLSDANEALVKLEEALQQKGVLLASR